MPNNLSAFDTAPVSITQKALSQNFNLEEKERREEADKNKDFYYGKQEQDIVLMNDDVEPIVLNITKPIMGKRCNMLYSRPLVREFEGPQDSVDYLTKVYKENHIDALLLKVDLLSELTGSALIHPMPDEAMPSGQRFVIYDATQFSTLGADNDPSTADAISLIRIVDRLVDGPAIGQGGKAQPQVERTLEQQVWTNEVVSYYDGSTLVSTEPNPLGYLPFVNFKGEEVHDQYIGFPTANIVRRLNAQINQLLTHLGYTVKMQAGTPIVFSGFKSGETVVIHPGRAVNIPTGATADVLSLDPKIKETLEVINFLEDRLYTTSSVPKISVEGGEGNSGRELMVRWFPLLQVFQEKTVRFNRYELQLANMVLALAGKPPVESVVIKWPEESILPLSVADDNLERDIKLNLVSPIDEIMRRNPHMDEQDAEIEWRINKELNSEGQEQHELTAQSQDTGTTPDDPRDESAGSGDTTGGAK